MYNTESRYYICILIISLNKQCATHTVSVYIQYANTFGHLSAHGHHGFLELAM